MNVSEVGLIGDIGATNARFALVQSDGSTTPARVYALNDYRALADMVDAYLADESPPIKPRHAVLAVAAPITGDQITLTNRAWTFSIEGIRRHVGLERIRVINDFAVNAFAIPYLGSNDIVQIGAGFPIKDAPIALIGPGTGLGVSALVPTAGGAVPIPGEGGHTTMAPANARESAILDIMRKRYGHVSAERVLSGPGLVNLYNTLCELSAAPAAPFMPAQITNPSTWDEDPHTLEATAMFCAMLGTVAGNLALTFGARGGVYVAGGIVPKLSSFFASSEFRTRFEAKGRLRAYLATIPTYLIVRPLPALLGAAALLRQP